MRQEYTMDGVLGELGGNQGTRRIPTGTPGEHADVRIELWQGVLNSILCGYLIESNSQKKIVIH